LLNPQAPTCWMADDAHRVFILTKTLWDAGLLRLAREEKLSPRLLRRKERSSQ
jgi:hypothetical protein